jgi:GT2 family glycosyltransferase
MGGGTQITMSVDVSLVLVAYHSSGVARAAVESFRRESLWHGVTSEVVIVDQSEDAAEVERLGSLAPEKLLVLPNRGYAAGVNSGVAASTGVTLVTGNPDVAFGDGSLAALLAAIDTGWHIVGPQFVLADLLFPPADLQTPGEEFRRWLASRMRAFWRRHFRRELRRWRRVWEAEAPVAVRALSGALLAFRRETFNKVGMWDEGFFLYFEETDWLRRAMSDGLRIALVPKARVEHRWGHAADPAAMLGHALASRGRFFAAHFGLRGRLVTALTVSRTPLQPRPLARDQAHLPGGEVLWLVSPTLVGFPAAGYTGTATAFLAAVETFCDALARPARYLVFAVEPLTGELVGCWSWERTDG